jgi:regulator of nucleoside diphosphate kinase
MTARRIIISREDRDRLQTLINSARLDSRVSAANLAPLEGELARAAIVSASELPPDVVTMNSRVWFRDLETEEYESYTLVYPPQADVAQHRISVLAPIGTALLGYRVRDVVEWRVPAGTRRLQVFQVSQPAMQLAVA